MTRAAGFCDPRGGSTRLETARQISISDREVRVAPPTKPDAVDQEADVGADHGGVPREAGDGAEEVAKEDGDAVQLDAEADQGPLHQDEDEAEEEGCGALGLLFPREEEQRLLRSDDDGEAYEEKDLLGRGLGAQTENVLVSSIVEVTGRTYMYKECRPGSLWLRTFPMASLYRIRCSALALRSLKLVERRGEERGVGGALGAHIARSKNSITPAIRKKPPTKQPPRQTCRG